MNIKTKIKAAAIVILIMLCTGCIEESDKEKPDDEIKNVPPSLIILNPGVEEWVGWTVDIQWSASDADNDTVKIDIWYGKDDKWNLIASNLTMVSSYDWDTTYVDNGPWVLRLTANDGTDLVQHDINITVHKDWFGLVITSPEGGDVYSTECNISWESIITPRRGSDDISIYYTNNNGTDWNFIADGFPLNSGFYYYLWNTTGLPSSEYYQIKLHSDSKDMMYTPVLSGYFTIEN
jgi:hypothetical protein